MKRTSLFNNNDSGNATTIKILAPTPKCALEIDLSEDGDVGGEKDNHTATDNKPGNATGDNSEDIFTNDDEEIQCTPPANSSNDRQTAASLTPPSDDDKEDSNDVIAATADTSTDDKIDSIVLPEVDSHPPASSVAQRVDTLSCLPSKIDFGKCGSVLEKETGTSETNENVTNADVEMNEICDSATTSTNSNEVKPTMGTSTSIEHESIVHDNKSIINNNNNKSLAELLNEFDMDFSSMSNHQIFDLADTLDSIRRSALGELRRRDTRD